MALSAVLTIATWASVIRIVTALAAFVAAREAIPDGRIPVEAHVLMVLILAAAGAVLVYGGHRETRCVALGTMFVLLASSFSPRMLSGFAETPVLGAAVPFIARFPTEALFAAAGWLFAYSFPSAPSGWPIQRLSLLVAWAATVLGLLLIAMNLGGLLFPDASWAELTHHQRPGRSVFWMMLVLMGAPILPVIFWKARAVSLAEQSRVRRFAAGMIFGLLPSTVLLLGLALAPSIRPHVETYAREYGVLFYGGLLTIPLSTAFAVKASRVLPARLALRVALLGVIARSSLIVLLVLPLAWLASEVRRSTTITIEQFLARPGISTALVLATIGALLLFFRPQVLALVERWFDRQRADVGRALALATGHIRTAVGPRELAEAVRKCLSDTFGTSQLTVLLGALHSPTLSAVTDGSPIQLARASALASLLETEPVPIIVAGAHASRCVRLLPFEDQYLLASNDTELICAIPNTSGRLLGAVLLGPRANELPYSRADLESIGTLCATAGIAVETRFLSNAESVSDVSAAVECVVCGLVLEPSVATCSCGGALKDARVPIVVSGRYRVIRMVGAGGMGVVYEGVDVMLGRKVALKALPAVTRGEAERLTEEARVMASLSHPNIAHVYGLDFWRDTPILAMEFMTHGTLADAIRHGVSFSNDEAATIERSLSAALEHLHSNGLIHRDIKPSNIGLRAGDEVALLDFGIAAEVGSAEAAVAGGTLKYLPPDVLGGAPQTDASDRWAATQVIRELRKALEDGK